MTNARAASIARARQGSCRADRWKPRSVAGENALTFAAFALFTGLVVLALAGSWLAPCDPLASDTSVALQPPSASDWFGADALGRDILSRRGSSQRGASQCRVSAPTATARDHHDA